MHICVKDIYEPYKSGAAWEITLDLLENYGHDALPFHLNRIENVIINENDKIENISYKLLQNGKNTTVIDIITFSDIMLQCHAFKMEQIMLNLSQLIGNGNGPISESTGDIDLDSVINTIDTMWSTDYITSLQNMKHAVIELDALDGIKCEILDIMRTAAWYKICEAESIVGQKDPDLKEAKRIYQEGVDEIDNEHFTNAAEKFLKAFEVADCLVTGEPYQWQEEEQIWTMQSYLIISTVIILVVILCAIVRFRKKNERFKE